MRLTTVFVAMAALAVAVAAPAQTPVFINEIHYDNTGTDTGEAVEIAGPAGTDLTGWSIVRYNGANGQVYTTPTANPAGSDVLSGTIPNQCNGFGTVVVYYLQNGLQNGAQDGIALVNAANTVVQFLSYEGSFTATNGPASGMTSTDIGVSENEAPLGQSLQLTGTGSNYEDFTWTAAASTFGACNSGQTFTGGPQAPLINEFVANHTGTDNYEYVEVRGDPSTDYSAFWVLQVEGDAGSIGTVDAAWQVGTTNAAGYWTTGFLTNVLENGSLTLLLVKAFTGSAGIDLDTNDDGVIDVTPWDLIVDSVAVHDGGAGDLVFSAAVLGVSYDGAPFAPGGASRIPDGTDTDAATDWVRNDFDGAGLPGFTGTPVFGEAYNTPGAVNAAVPEPAGDLVINEIDYDQSSTDTAEFIEIRNNGSAAVNLDNYSLELVNGSGGGASIYATIDLPSVSLPAGGYYVICANAATVPHCDLDVSPDTDLVQNGAPDAVALRYGTTLVDTVSYEGDTGSPYTETSGVGLEDNPGVAYAGISRYPDGSDTNVNNVDFSQRCITPGAPNSSASSDCPNPGAFLAVLINEVDADTPGTDAAEFVELYDGGVGNVPLDGLVVVFYNGSNDLSYAAFDLDGYSTNGNGYFVICGNATNVAGCDLDVTPDTDLIQNGADAVTLFRANGADFPSGTAVTTSNLQDAIVYDTSDADDAGLLVLLNLGQPQVDENGAGNSAGQSNQRCPNGSGGMRNTAAYVQAAPTPGAANLCVSGTYEIWQIQGNGLASPYAGQVVATNDNIVTAVGPQGFFIQTPDARADADPETSNGIYVYTNSAPAVNVGDQVDVVGTVQEFYDFTEIAGGPVVTVDSSGNPLPAAIEFNASLPSPTQPQPATAYERYEGMRITIPSGLVSGPSQYFGTDNTAEAFIVASTARPFREPGIRYPGLPGLPVWDGNPEVFELDSDKFAESFDPIAAGSTFSATGVLGYEYGGYELWATSLTLGQAPLPVPVRPRAPGEFTVGSLNCYRLFDDVNDPGSADDGSVESTAAYTRHLRKLSRYIREVLDAPDVLGVQEVEHIGALEDLAAQIHADDPSLTYTAYLEEGNDVGGIDVGFLVRDTMAVDAVTQLQKDEPFVFGGGLLHDRPPLLFEGRYVASGTPFPVKVLVIHNRSLNGIDDPVDGDRVRHKRLEQAQAVATIIQDLQAADPAVHLVVVGDFNAYEVSDGYVDVTGQIKGEFVPADNLLSGPDLVDPNLVDEVLNLPAAERYSYVHDGTAQVLDHALWAHGLATFARGMAYGRGNADAPEVYLLDDTTPLRCSDHDGLVFYVMSDANGDGYPDDAPQFATSSNANGTATGTVTDASGVASVVLVSGSVNVTLQTSGNPGDSTWGWTVTLVDDRLPGTAVLEARDADGRVSRYQIYLSMASPIPAASPAGLVALATLLAAAAVVALRRT